MLSTLATNPDTPVSPFRLTVVEPHRVATASRDGHLALRRVERQQRLVELLYASGRRHTLAELGRDLGVSARTVARDVERLRLAGAPIDVVPGRTGGVSLPRAGSPAPIAFDLPEVAALVSSLTVLGPTATASAGSAMRKLTDALSPPPER
jgi:predicted DNA-binding transcriptional regulator YafY